MSESQVSKAEAAQERSEQTRSFVRKVKAATRRKYTPEEKISIVMEGFCRELPANDPCRREGIKPHSYYAWTKEFMEAGKERLARDSVGMPRGRRSGNSDGRTGSLSSSLASSHSRCPVSKKRPSRRW